MNNEIIMRKKQMLEALDYIDDDLIAGTLRKIKPETFANTSEPPKMTWRTPFKHWRQFVALAACILLLSIASPLVSYVAEVISNFNAGAGSGTTEEINETTIPENTEFPDNTRYIYGDYLKPIKNLELLPVGIFENIKKYSPNYVSLSDIRYTNVSSGQSDRYLGCFNGYYIFMDTSAGGGGAFTAPYLINIGGYTFFDYHSFELYAYKNSKIEQLGKVYRSGLISEDQLKTIYLRNNEYLRYFEPEIKIPDVLPITEDDFINLNEAWAEGFGRGEKLSESIDELRIEHIPGGVDCFGKIGSCIFFVTKSEYITSNKRTIVADYEFCCVYNDELWIMFDDRIYSVQEAYELEIISADTVGEFAYCFGMRCAGIINY